MTDFALFYGVYFLALIVTVKIAKTVLSFFGGLT